jgi:hypothetical protein
MKNLFGLLIILITSLIAEAGPSISGGVSPAPRAVVIQGHFGSNKFDQIGRKKYLQLAGRHLLQERIVAIVERPEFQEKDRTYVCIEYKTTDDYWAATQEFKKLLAQHPTIEVVSNRGCN